MMVNMDGKYCSEAEYFYNEYCDCYCIVGSTHAFLDLQDLIDAFESEDLLTEVPMPDYITDDYDGPCW